MRIMPVSAIYKCHRSPRYKYHLFPVSFAAESFVSMAVIAISHPEINRMHVLHDVMADCITVNEAAQLMWITRRQVFRLCCRSQVRNDLQQVLAEPPAAVRESREITGQQPG